MCKRGAIKHLAHPCFSIRDHNGVRLWEEHDPLRFVESYDRVQAGTHLHTIIGLHEPQGVVFLPESNTIVVTNGKTGMCEMFDGTSFTHRTAVKLASDADNIRYDAATHTLY